LNSRKILINQGVFEFNSSYNNNLNEATKVATKTFYAISQFFQLYDLSDPVALQVAESQVKSWGGKIVKDALLIP
jgi:hypothetical protein